MTDLARLDTDNWELENAVQRHLSAPSTFWIPSEDARRNLKVGQAAKLIFKIRVFDDAGNPEVVTERMWVYVTRRRGDLYEGRLQSQAEATLDFRPGTQVRFLAEHVCDIDDPPRAFQPRCTALCSFWAILVGVVRWRFGW
jgi:hypothetical protein